MPPHHIRLLQHVNQFNPDMFEFTGHPALTQDGIAEALGISRAHTALIISRLPEEDLVECRLLHIDGRKRRVKAYVITRIGRRYVAALDQ